MSSTIFLNKLNSLAAEKCYEIISNEVTIVKRFSLRGRNIMFKIKAIPEGMEPTSWIKEAIEEIIQYSFKELAPGDKVGITFSGKGFSEERGSGWISFRNASEIQLNDVWDMITKIFQSNSEGLDTDSFSIKVTSVKIPTGLGRRNANYYNTFEEECVKRRGIVSIKNKDNLCLPRALVVGIAFADKSTDYNSLRTDKGKKQTTETYRLLSNAQVEVPSEGCGIPELQLFQAHLGEAYTITVYEYRTKGHTVIYKGIPTNNNAKGKRINLLHHKQHFNLITSLTSAFCCSYYCEICHVPYNDKSRHCCVKSCPQCQKTPGCERVPAEILCGDCHRKFRGQICFDNHKSASSGKKSICEEMKRCKECLKTTSYREHFCNEYFCKQCGKFVPQEHQCFMLPDGKTPKTNNCLYIFYDFESRQEDVETNEADGSLLNIHKPNLCVFQQRCSSCIHIEKLMFCNTCKFRQQIISEDVVSKFLQYILKVRQLFKNVIVLAHNGQAYDHQFILNFILVKTSLKPELIMRGTKILMMNIANVKFLDSINYFPMALSKLPKAFDLSPSLKKGYFPHFFNTSENAKYVGKLPSVKYYGADTMKTEDRVIFLKWYDEHKNDEFNMERDLIDYCISDVKILVDSCLKFRNLFLTQSNVEPFLESTTIASACSLVYRRNFLIENTIGLIPKNGYRNVNKHSKVSIKWLIWEAKNRNICIKHAANGKEAVVAGVKVDGFCEETNQVFEFHGCYYHGHPVCMTHRRNEPLEGDKLDTLNLRFERTQSKTKRLRSFNYEVIEIWNCEFQRKHSMMSQEDLVFLRTHPLVEKDPLNPRDAFYGGRTGNTLMYYKCKSGEKINYIDVCSLYPWVCKYGKYPIGHPKLYTDPSITSHLELKDISGLIKCKVLPPENLFHPVLPIKQNNKLIFTLCMTCSNIKSRDKFCYHSDDERSICGTWVIEEVVKALEKGYKLVRIIEIWEYNVIQYNKENNSKGLFDSMMNKFLKIKQEASGWPSNCETEAEKQSYISHFLENENIQLDYANISHNQGKRSFSKLILNSFWGKFGQRENQTRTRIVNSPSELYEVLTNPTLEVCNILPVNDENVVINFVSREEAAESLPSVNVSIAAYTTTQARLKLYEYLEKLDRRVLYYDTDSVIYISREGDFEPETGDLIGDMTDELELYGKGSFITEFVSGGPKNYAFKVFNPKNKTENIVCKVKGISLNYDSSKKVNFDSIKEAVLSADDRNESILIASDNIIRTKEHRVVTKRVYKTYRPVSEKRNFLPNYSSLPYGFQRKSISPSNN